MRPIWIRRFEWLFLIGTVAPILAIFLNYGALRNQAIANGTSPAGPIAAVFLALVIALPIWFLIARRASNVAKWILIVLSLLTLFALPGDLRSASEISVSYLVLYVVGAVGWFGAAAVLFQPEVSRWLKSGGSEAPVDPSTFD